MVLWGGRTTAHKCRQTVAGWPRGLQGHSDHTAWDRWAGRPMDSTWHGHTRTPEPFEPLRTHLAPGWGLGVPGGGCGLPGSACVSPAWRGYAPSWGVGGGSEHRADEESPGGPHPRWHLLPFQLGQGLLLGLAVELDAFEVGGIIQREAPVGRRRHPGDTELQPHGSRTSRLGPSSTPPLPCAGIRRRRPLLPPAVSRTVETRN